MPDPQDIYDSLNDNQRDMLGSALLYGERDRQMRGRKTLRATDCDVAGRYSGVAPTKRKLQSLRLLTGATWRPSLTPLGLKVAKIAWDADEHRRAAEDDAHQARTVEQFVTEEREEEKREEREYAEQIARAKRLWRGVTGKEHGTKKAMSTFIEERFRPYGDGSRHGTLHLDLDAIIHIGEQIERRKK